MTPKKHKGSFVMIGTGNVATHLTASLIKSGYVLKQIAGRNQKTAAAFAKKFSASFTVDLNAVTEDADVYFLCVNDDNIENAAKHLSLKNKLVLHCSGSTDLEVLKVASTHYGVMWPLYTFSKNDAADFSGIPIFIEGNNPAAERIVKQIASALSEKVIRMKSAEREKLHLAAVMTSNFSNFLFGMADEFLAKEKAGKFSYLLPLIEKTVSKLETHSPYESQTGPARRHDTKVIKKHLELLKNYPEHKKLYTLLSNGIEGKYIWKK